MPRRVFTIKERVVWILLSFVLAVGSGLVGYHLSNIPYEGWEGMQHQLRFPEILFPKYPFRVLPLVATLLFGMRGADLAEKLFTKWFLQQRNVETSKK